jgi:hypothetical protein
MATKKTTRNERDAKKGVYVKRGREKRNPGGTVTEPRGPVKMPKK